MRHKRTTNDRIFDIDFDRNLKFDLDFDIDFGMDPKPDIDPDSELGDYRKLHIERVSRGNTTGET